MTDNPLLPDEDDRGLAARAAALGVLEAALERRRGLEAALAEPACAALPPRDRAFARAVTMAALRQLRPIDAALDARMRRPPPMRVRNLLRIALAQAFVLKSPAYAVVATSVDLAAADSVTRPFKGLVNAVLRAAIREGSPPSAPGDLAPPWLYARWRAAFGEAAAEAVEAQIVVEPAADLSLRDPADAASLSQALPAELLPGGGLRTTRRGDLAAWPGYDQGAWWVQDAAAMIPARLLAVGPGQAVLDLCAAPGGKSLQLAAAGAQVTALDRSVPRLRRMAENLARTRLTAEIVATEAAAWSDLRLFDGVLLDAPCSATGTFRRHPDVLQLVGPADIGKLAAVQSRLLDDAARRVRPGGRLVYCVCSLEPEEGEQQAAAFLARHDAFSTLPVVAGEGGAAEVSLTSEGWLRLLPHQRPGGQDGFFAARFARRA